MAHSNPKGIANLGDAQRVGRAVAYFVTVLLTDPRVDEFYQHWRDACDAFYDSLDDEILGDREIFLDDRREIERILKAKQQAYARWGDTMQDEVAFFIREQLPQLSQWVVWLAPELQNAFVVKRLTELDPHADNRVYVPVRVSERTPKGRQLPRDGAGLERNVRWFYRNKVKQPDEKIKALAREHAAAERRSSPDAGFQVRSGIKQVISLFDIAARNYEPGRRQP